MTQTYIGEFCYTCDMAKVTHGEASPTTLTAEYRSYNKAKQRCTAPTHPRYADYGGRGIEFRFKAYLDFLDDIGRKPSPLHSLERINNNGHYEKGNVRWATTSEQNRNRRDNRHITVNGETKLLVEWAEATGVDVKRIHARIARGWSPEQAILTPQKRQRRYLSAKKNK